RLSDQIESFYGEHTVQVDGKRIEVYAIGLGSWTLVQEATYLTSHLSAYDPDLILLLSVENDLTYSFGVTGSGAVTFDFSAECRDWGSGVFHNRANAPFETCQYASIASLQWDLSPASHECWKKGMAALKKLVNLQHRRGKRILLSTLDMDNCGENFGSSGYCFSQQFFEHVREAKIDAPYVRVTYMRREQEHRLPHDSHPSRKGYTLLRDQYIHALDRLGWVDMPEDMLPTLDARINLEINPDPDQQGIDSYLDLYVEKFMHTSLDFLDLTPQKVNAFLGGVFPDSRDKPFAEYPWASIRAGFLLKLPQDRRAERVEVQIKARPLVELFPLEIALYLNGEQVNTCCFEEPNPTNLYVLEGEMPDVFEDDRVVEVVLITDSYFTSIEDYRMKSYQLVSASIR
ncbi:MAG: hypothetical protein KJ645_13910, partial [Planctomycetes bacterium]|nr:hypothetical protein [Planctomycetota bacterium]